MKDERTLKRVAEPSRFRDALGPACVQCVRLRKPRDRVVRSRCFGRLANSRGTTYGLFSIQRVERALGQGVRLSERSDRKRLAGAVTYWSCNPECDAPSACVPNLSKRADSASRPLSPVTSHFSPFTFFPLRPWPT